MPLSLAQLPTPTQYLSRLSARLGAEVWIKRDDLTGFGLSGNKVRKLELLLNDALERGCHSVVTCGGIQSNHCRATALAARQLGLEPILLLRGAAPAIPEANLLLDHLLGAEIHFCNADDYRWKRDQLMQEIARPDSYIIPEGGSNGLGALAFARASAEVKEGPFDAVICAVGTGGTLTGLALGAELGPIMGIAVCEDRTAFRQRVDQIAADATNFGLGTLPPIGQGWDIIEGYQGPAYAIATPEIWDTIRLLARLEGVLLDPVYTGKAMHALVTEVQKGNWGQRLLFWHTGGAFGLFGRGKEVVTM